MASALLQLLYRGDRAAATALARNLPELDVFEAAGFGALEALIERCEEDAARVNSYTDDGWTPLHLAAYFGNNACVKDLLRRGADIEALSGGAFAVTPLQSACSADRTIVAATLIAHGADVNALSSAGFRALDSARQNANAELIELLVAAGAIAGAPTT